MRPDLTTLAGIELDGDEPVFNEPWQAQAFAMTISLHEKGVFTWTEWADALSAEVLGDEERGYYNHWLAALEKLVAAKKISSADAIATREKQWHEAAARTPHGEPIVL